MIVYKKGSVFDILEENRPVILTHAVNCKGVWGSGIAKYFKDIFPSSFLHYQAQCKKYGKENLGSTYIIRDGSVHIACMFTSDGYGENVDSEESILFNTELAIKSLLSKSSNMEIHMPKINSGLFNVPWEKTEEILNRCIAEQIVVVWEV